MARVVNRVWLDAGEAPGIIIDGMLRIEFSSRDVVKAKRLLEELCRFLGERLGKCNIEKLER